MPCSDAKRLANQRNAQKSTGPKTDAGKLAARLNSLTHGMRSEHGLVPKHLTEAVAKHQKMLSDHYRPEDDHQRWLLSQVAEAAAKLDYCQFMIRAEIDDMADRADLCWDEDRTLAAEEIASRLPKDPSRTAARLRETPQGCRWILARWDALSVSLADNTPWDEDQCNLAARLMGVDSDLRPSYPALNPSATAEDHAAILNENADSIHTLMVDSLEPLDAKERELTRLGFPLRPSKEYLRFERYEAKHRKVYHEALKSFLAARTNPVHVAEPLTALEAPPLIEPPIVTPVSLEPATESPDGRTTTPQPEFQSGQSIVSMLAEAVGLFQTRQGPSDPENAPTAPPTQTRPKLPLDRRARRAQAALERQRKKKSR